MKKILFMLSSFMFSRMLGAVGGGIRNNVEVTRLKMALFYIKGIKTARLLFISLLGIGISLIFLGAGLILLHAALFMYAPISNHAKMIMGLVCASVYIIIALAAFFYVFDEDKWLKIFHAGNVFERLQDEERKRTENNG